MLRRGSWKYVLAPRPELYDLSSDPSEQHNVVDEQPARAAALRGTLAKLLDAERRAGTTSNAGGTLPVDLLQRLGALGYVAGDASVSSTGADPKDKIADFRRANDGMRRGILALNQRDYASASRVFEELINSGIESFEVHLYLARAFAGMNRADRAAAHFEQAARRAPLLEDAWAGWAEASLATDGPESAIAIVREGRKKNPRSPQLAVLDADMSLRLHKPDDAVAAFEAALPLLPRDASIRRRLLLRSRWADAAAAFQRAVDRGHPAPAELEGLGYALLKSDQFGQAAKAYQRLCAVYPRKSPFWVNLGLAYADQEPANLREAEKAFREAIARDTTNHRYVFNLGLALARQGRSREARPYFEKTLQLAPDFAPAREELQKLPMDRRGQ